MIQQLLRGFRRTTPLTTAGDGGPTVTRVLGALDWNQPALAVVAGVARAAASGPPRFSYLKAAKVELLAAALVEDPTERSAAGNGAARVDAVPPNGIGSLAAAREFGEPMSLLPEALNGHPPPPEAEPGTMLNLDPDGPFVVVAGDGKHVRVTRYRIKLYVHEADRIARVLQAFGLPPRQRLSPLPLQEWCETTYWERGARLWGAPSVELSASPGVVVAGGRLVIAWGEIQHPTGGDWITLCRAGAPIDSYLTYWYTNGTPAAGGAGVASGRQTIALPAGLVPGAYDLRLFASNTFDLLASTAIAVVESPPDASSAPAPEDAIGPALEEAGAALVAAVEPEPPAIPVPVTVEPAVVPAGASLRARWSDLPTPTGGDWFCLAPVGAPSGNCVLYRYTNGSTKARGSGAAQGEIPLHVPTSLPPGPYELRLFANSTLALLGKAELTVAAPLAHHTVVDDAGRAPRLGFGIARRARRWLAAQKSRLVAVQRRALPAQQALRQRLDRAALDQRLNSARQRVAPRTTLRVSPSTVVPGASLTVRWRGVPNPTSGDWIVLYRHGAPNEDAVIYCYTDGAQGAGGSGLGSGQVALAIPVGLPSGLYEVRLFANNSFTLLASAGLTVIEAALSVSPMVAPAGSKVTAQWRDVSPPTGGDWIVLCPAGTPNDQYVLYRYTNGTPTAGGSGRRAGRLAFPLPADLSPGAYELRLFTNNSFVPLATTTLTVTEPDTTRGATWLSHAQRLRHGVARRTRPRLAALRRPGSRPDAGGPEA